MISIRTKRASCALSLLSSNLVVQKAHFTLKYLGTYFITKAFSRLSKSDVLERRLGSQRSCPDQTTQDLSNW